MFLVTGVIVNSVVKSVEDKVTIQIFIKDGAATADVSALQQSLVAESTLVEGVSYTNKDQALAKFKQDMAQSPEIIQQLEGNPLPASLDVTLKDPRTVEQMVAKIKANALFLKVADRPDNPEESLKYGQQIVKKLFAFTRVATLARDCVRLHARDRLAHPHQQHDPPRHLRAPQGDRHHAPRRSEQLVHPDAVPARGPAAVSDWRRPCNPVDRRTASG